MEWTPGKIRRLRERRGQTQVEFAKDLYDLEDEHTLQVYVSRMETGSREPTSAVRKTLERMEKGEI